MTDMILGMQGKQAMVLGAAMLVMVFFAACSATTRFRVLNFFFDGVPPPSGITATDLVSERDTGSGLRDAMNQMRQNQTPAVPARVVRSVHKPYQERQCSECHDMARGTGDIAHDASLCDKCHYEDRRRGGWDHGPINLGTCVPCHTPHNSEHEKLLALPIPDLCLTCHIEETPTRQEYHDVPNFNDCVACHDPHRMY